MNVSVALVRTLHDALRAVQLANETARDEVYMPELMASFMFSYLSFAFVLVPCQQSG